MNLSEKQTQNKPKYNAIHNSIFALQCNIIEYVFKADLNPLYHKL